MKKTTLKTTLIITTFLLMSVVTFAQSYEFRVIGSKGSVLLDGKILRVGTRINLNQVIEIGKGAYLGLAHRNSKTLELTKAGTFKVSDLKARLTATSGSLASKYARFVANELTSDDSRKTRFAQRVKTGSVSRGLDDIKFMLPAASTYVDPASVVTMKWYYDEPVTPKGLIYDVVITKISADDPKVLFSTKTDKTEIQLDLSDPIYADISNINVEVSTIYKGELARRAYGLRKLKGSKLQLFNNEIKEFTDTESPLGQIILARFYEDKKLFANAVHQYEKAIEVADIDQYKMLYNEFLKGNMMTKSSRKHASPND